MKVITRPWAFLGAILFSISAFAAKPTAGFIPVSKNQEIYVQYTPAEHGKTTLVVLNGLNHTIENWNAVLKNLKLNGVGLLQIDLEGQGKTLAHQGNPTGPIKYQNQVVYVAKILQHLNIQHKVSLLSLSYGGGIATVFAAKYPNQVEKLILLAPYTEPQPQQDQWIRDQVTANRIAFPYNPATDDELYDYYLQQLVYSTYPAADPTLLTTPYKLEAVYRMAQGIRKLHTARFISTLPTKSVYLVGGDSDQVVLPYEVDNFWKALPNQTKCSRLILKGADHVLTDIAPKTIAWWVELILSNDPKTLGGTITTVSPK